MKNRLFEIIYILLNKNRVTATYLAERFEISQRTVYRDIDTLTLAGIPVYTEKGKGGGISLLPEYILNKSILDEKEQNEILTALQSLSVIKGSADNTDKVINKLSAVFNKSMPKWLEIDFSSWGFDDGKIFNDLKTAILELHVVKFEYFNAYGEISNRSVEPIQLWFKSKAWYVKGFCLTKQDIRLFKLTRIRNLFITDTRIIENRNLLETQKQTDCDKVQFVNLKLKIAPQMAYRIFDEFGSQSAKKQQDGSYIVSVIWPEDDWVYGMILSFGEHIEVLDPPHIQEIIKKKAKIIAKKYS